METNNTDEKIRTLRKQLPLVKETLQTTINRERELEKAYFEAKNERSILQAYFNSLEIKLIELENRIQRPKPGITKEKKIISIIDEKELLERMLASLTPDQIKAVMANFK